MTHSTHKEELHAGTARGLHHLAGRLRGRGGLARMVGTRRTRVSRLARPATGTRLTILMGANTYRLMSGFATESNALASDEPMTDEGAAIAELARTSKIVFSSALQPPLSWPNTRLISGDAVPAVAAIKP